VIILLTWPDVVKRCDRANCISLQILPSRHHLLLLYFLLEPAHPHSKPTTSQGSAKHYSNGVMQGPRLWTTSWLRSRLFPLPYMRTYPCYRVIRRTACSQNTAGQRNRHSFGSSSRWKHLETHTIPWKGKPLPLSFSLALRRRLHITTLMPVSVVAQLFWVSQDIIVLPG
jgi:hypothetical protein